MWAHYLLTFYRSLTRHRLYAALNIFGLAIGIAVFLALWLDVRFETSFERWIPDARSVYLIHMVVPGEGPYRDTMGGALDELRGDYPQLVGTRDWSQSATVRQGAQATSEHVEVVDPSFFKVFDLPVVAGDKAGMLSAPDDLVLTQAKARQYFGTADPIGQRLTLFFLGQARSYRVTGVLKDPPRNTELQFDFLVPLTQAMVAGQTLPSGRSRWWFWGSGQVYTYLRFERPAQAAALGADLDNFVDRHAGQDLTPPPAHRSLTLHLSPLLGLHLMDAKDAGVVAAIGVVGLLTLLLAGVNYVNLATARGGLRAREVALRKVMGATGPSLIAQFMSEALATAVLAALIGLALCELALPLINAAGGLALKIEYLNTDSILLPVLITVLVVGLGAGVYPALVLSRFQPAAVLASTRTPGGGRWAGRVREALVLVQFAVAIAFTIATGVIVSQTNYLRDADLGFDRNGLIVVRNFDNSEITDAQRAGLLDAWRGIPGVVGDTAAQVAPGLQHSAHANAVHAPGAVGEGPDVRFVSVGEGFFQTYGVRLLTGRLLDRNHGGDDTPRTHAAGAAPSPNTSPQNVVLNAKAVQALGFRNAADAIGKPLSSKGEPYDLTAMTVVGVIDDVHFLSPHQPNVPAIFQLNTGDFPGPLAGVRYAGVDPRQVTSLMERQWRRIVPTVPMHAQTVEDSLQQLYKDDDQHGRLFIIGAVLAVLIGCVGLYGLASFNTARRVREIGIRKTLGASTRDILQLLITQFLRPVLLANLIAWPLAWLAMRSWLSTFDQRIGLGPVYFLGATALTLLIAVGTVAGQALAVARSEPAKALRHE